MKAVEHAGGLPGAERGQEKQDSTCGKDLELIFFPFEMIKPNSSLEVLFTTTILQGDLKDLRKLK